MCSVAFNRHLTSVLNRENDIRETVLINVIITQLCTDRLAEMVESSLKNVRSFERCYDNRTELTKSLHDRMEFAVKEILENPSQREATHILIKEISASLERFDLPNEALKGGSNEVDQLLERVSQYMEPSTSKRDPSPTPLSKKEQKYQKYLNEHLLKVLKSQIEVRIAIEMFDLKSELSSAIQEDYNSDFINAIHLENFREYEIPALEKLISKLEAEIPAKIRKLKEDISNERYFRSNDQTRLMQKVCRIDDSYKTIINKLSKIIFEKTFAQTIIKAPAAAAPSASDLERELEALLS